MIVDPEDPKSLANFFQEFRGLTTPELAIVANASTGLIRTWKKRCGIAMKADPFIKKKKPYTKVPREVWDNADWLREHYIDKGIGIRTLAKIMGYRGFASVCDHLKRHGIETRKLVLDPCRSKDWLYYHYSTREEYLEWCESTNQKPDEHGGMGLTLEGCAEQAGVVPYTILNWLSKFRMRIRDKHESTSLNSKENERKNRDRFFKLYRSGEVPLTIKSVKFYNGTRMDKQKD
tara:strand:+ start:37791 stop:38489 length:699 start_codon:yes stop_codon:yes gene_type:complete